MKKQEGRGKTEKRRKHAEKEENRIASKRLTGFTLPARKDLRPEFLADWCLTRLAPGRAGFRPLRDACRQLIV